MLDEYKNYVMDKKMLIFLKGDFVEYELKNIGHLKVFFNKKYFKYNENEIEPIELYKQDRTIYDFKNRLDVIDMWGKTKIYQLKRTTNYYKIYEER